MRRFTSLLRAGLCLAMLSSCGPVSLPPRITVNSMEPSGYAAKPKDCSMEVLRSDPLRAYREVAIIEGVGNVFGKESDVLPQMKGEACQLGADAMVVKESRSQTSENMTGYYVNATAIVWGSRSLSTDKTILK